MKKNILCKAFVIGLLISFIGVAVAPTIIGDYNKEQDYSILTFYTFNKTKTNKCKVELPTHIAKEISNLFEDLKNNLINNFKTDEIQILKKNFTDILDFYGLIPKELSKDNIYSLLNPKWLPTTRNYNHIKKNSITETNINKNIFPRASSEKGSVFFCSIVGSGKGLLFSPIMLPRPRFASIWTSVINAESMAANLFTGWGFVASGPQNGIALGFMGIGISFAFPGQPAFFDFIGYALAVLVRAENVQNYP